jgi:hypothetical protein
MLAYSIPVSIIHDLLHASPQHASLEHVILLHASPQHASLEHVILLHASPQHVILHHAISAAF